MTRVTSNYFTSSNIPAGHVSKSCCVWLLPELFSAGKAKWGIVLMRTPTPPKNVRTDKILHRKKRVVPQSALFKSVFQLINLQSDQYKTVKLCERSMSNFYHLNKNYWAQPKKDDFQNWSSEDHVLVFISIFKRPSLDFEVLIPWCTRPDRKGTTLLPVGNTRQ